MNDVFNEQLVARKPNQKDLIQKIGIGAAGAVLIFVALNVQALMGFILPIIAVIIVGVVFLFRRYNIEYEYVFTNGDLDVDKIINKSKRKNALSVNVRSFETMVPVSNKDYEKEVSRFTKLYDFSSGTVKENTYAAIFDKDKERCKMIFEPDEQMFKAIRTYIPRIVKK